MLAQNVGIDHVDLFMSLVCLNPMSLSFRSLEVPPQIESIMARTKNKPVLRTPVVSRGYSLRSAFLSRKHNKFTSRHSSLSPLSQTFIWFERFWLDNKFGLQPFPFDELFKSCDKYKFPLFCRNHILHDGKSSVGNYARKLESYARYFYEALLGPNRKFDVHYDVLRGKMLKTRYEMSFSEMSDALIGFVDKMDYHTADIFSSIGYDSLYTNLAGRSTEYVIPLLGIMKFVSHQCCSPMRISRKPVYRHVLGNRYRCIQMLIERSSASRVFRAGSEVVMDYCYKDNELPFTCYCSNCVVDPVDA